MYVGNLSPKLILRFLIPDAILYLSGEGNSLDFYAVCKKCLNLTESRPIPNDLPDLLIELGRLYLSGDGLLCVL